MKSHKDDGLQHDEDEERLRTVIVHSGEAKAQGDLTNMQKYLKGGYKDAVRLFFSGVWHQETRGNGHNLKPQGVFSEDQKTLFTVRHDHWLVGHSHFLIMELLIDKIVYLHVP